jgi:polygalacturonase
MLKFRRAAAVGLAPLVLALTMGTAAAQSRPDPCNPLSYGAVGDAVTDNTDAIQSAINACFKMGGGTVRLPVVDGRGGVYLTGPITLASHVRLLIDKGATLLGTTDHAKYQPAFINHPYQPHEALVSAYQADDTGIIGPGTIDGQGGKPASDGGPSWWAMTHPAGATVDGTTWYAAPYEDVPVSNGVPRPWLVEFYQCTNVTANDVALTNAPAENLVIRYSDHITASEVKATAPSSIAHTDGLDLIGSTHAILLFLNIDTGGDAVALKSGLPLKGSTAGDPKTTDVPQLPTHDVQIVNSTFAHGNGIVVGGEAANGVYNVVARNIVERDTEHGLWVKSSRARGNHATGIYNVMAQNVALTGVRRPFAISAYDPAAGDAAGPRNDRPRPIAALTPNIHDITISGLTATGASLASSIEGLPEACIRNVTLQDVQIATSGAGIGLQNMTGTFTNVSGTPPFVVRENVAVATAGTTPPLANSLPPNSPCGGDPTD